MIPKRSRRKDILVEEDNHTDLVLRQGAAGRRTSMGKVYKEGRPFPVLRVGSMYRIPKEGFDMWLSGK